MVFLGKSLIFRWGSHLHGRHVYRFFDGVLLGHDGRAGGGQVDDPPAEAREEWDMNGIFMGY